MAAGRNLLEVDGIKVTFGGVHAVEGVSFTLRYGEILGLVGPNGSGKTTLLNALTGVVRAGGTVRIGDRAVALGSPEPPRRAGLARVYQAPQLVAELTCVENVLLGASDRRARGPIAAWLGRPLMWRHERERLDAALRQLARVGLGDRALDMAAGLAYGDQRLVELARALAAEPVVLMLDEPSAGLNDAETQRLASVLEEVREAGTALLVVDHKIDFIDSLCDQVLVLELGKDIALGTPGEVWSNKRVRDAYLGVRGAA
ncbi:ABC transporter ATP-binding protein [Saccharopolyspora sp. NPDC000995]